MAAEFFNDFRKKQTIDVKILSKNKFLGPTKFQLFKKEFSVNNHVCQI
jgi:hypothetical protein